MTTEGLPICTTSMDNAELSIYDCYSDLSIENIISCLIGADCWGVTIIQNDTVKVKLNTYLLYERIGRCFNRNHPDFIPDSQYLQEEELRANIIADPNLLLSELINLGDRIDIYMFGEGSWKMRITKIECGYTYDFFK